MEAESGINPLLAHCISFTNYIGDGVYPLLGHLTHSCDPNVARFEHGDTTVLFALRPINVNEQVNIFSVELNKSNTVDMNDDFTAIFTEIR